MNRNLPPLDSHGGLSGHPDDAYVKVDFSVSLNAFGPAPHVLDAVRAAVIDEYPDPASVRVRQRASERWMCGVDEIVFGAGASELIYALVRTFVQPNDPVLILGPTFGEYQRAAQLVGAVVHRVDWNLKTSAVDLETMVAKIRTLRPVLTFVCTPNNPTGSTLGKDQLEILADVCTQVTGVLVVDQSYDAFASHPLGTPALRGHPSVVHLRSITKDHALAGIRAGFAVGPAGIMNTMELVRSPWSASTVAQEAAIAALSDQGDAHLAATIPRLRAERDRIRLACTAQGIRTLSGDTHTLLIDVGDASIVPKSLLKRYGIRTRDCTSFSLPQFIRIAARTERENDLLIAALPFIHELAGYESESQPV